MTAPVEPISDEQIEFWTHTIANVSPNNRWLEFSDRAVAAMLARIRQSEARIATLTAALAAAEARAMGPWQPIETARTAGHRRFLCWDSHYGLRIGTVHVRSDHDDWLSYVDSHGGSSKGGIRATHWMPLPPLPTLSQAEGR